MSDDKVTIPQLFITGVLVLGSMWLFRLTGKTNDLIMCYGAIFIFLFPIALYRAVKRDE